jgi:tetratricopeptide (TPR) repeat protein
VRSPFPEGGGQARRLPAALQRAEEHLRAGTGNLGLKARRLSILASLHTDQGRRADAIACLEECRGIYEARSDWPLVAWTLVQMAHCLVDEDPERSLDLLDQASVFLPAEDAALRWFAESNRTECLINLGRVGEALRAFAQVESLRPLHHRPGANLKSAFTAGRLLEALGKMREAEILFEEAVGGALRRGLYKDALLDLLYVFGFHVRHGKTERAAEVSLDALGEMERESAAVHEQLRAVWTQLIEVRAVTVFDGAVVKVFDGRSPQRGLAGRRPRWRTRD